MTGGTTIYEIARSLGVSPATVSRALSGRDHVAAETRRRVVAAAEELGYRPNVVARSLVTGAAMTLGLLVPDIANPFFPSLIKCVQQSADSAGYTLLLANTGENAAIEARYLDTMQSNAIRGVLTVGLSMPTSSVRHYVESGMKLISLDRKIRGGLCGRVQANNREGAYKATKHLLERGHQQIVYLAGPSVIDVSTDRMRGYMKAMSESMLSDSAWVETSDFNEDAGYEATVRLIGSGRRFTAIFAINDLAAIGCMAALKDNGVTVPGDVAVVGFDDIHLASYVSPSLTTVRQPIEAMAQQAVDHLVAQLTGAVAPDRPLSIRLPTELIERESTSSHVQ